MKFVVEMPYVFYGVILVCGFPFVLRVGRCRFPKVLHAAVVERIGEVRIAF